MADRPLAVRIPEDVMNVLEERVAQINTSTPEASVTVSSVVRYAINEYTDKLKKCNIQRELDFPFANSLDSHERQLSIEQGIIDTQDELVTYNEDQLEQLLQGLEKILNVWRNKENLQSQRFSNWSNLYNDLMMELDKIQLTRFNQQESDTQEQTHIEEGIEYTYECPVCCDTFYEKFIEVPDTVYCYQCNEEFNAYEGDNKYQNTLVLEKEWTEENEKWKISQRTNGFNSKDEDAEIDQSTYEELTSEEQDEYRECDICGRIIQKYTGVCRLDESTGLYECKACRR